ncbi:cyclophilin-like domain-containing protein [Pelagophyceae sp. CCMP2097]|nr:cyclophilin-like domain-containing protein [Pelagophyceae sp. CCMP2097]
MLTLVLALVLGGASSFAPQSRGRHISTRRNFFGPKVTNEKEKVTDVVRMRLRIKSPDGTNSFPMGDVDLELFGETAPEAVQVFKDLCAADAYAQKKFHRIIRGFLCQAGQGVAAPAYGDDAGALALKFGPGALAMSNAGSPGTGNGEFIVTTARAQECDGKYAVIGRVSAKTFDVFKKVEKQGSVDGDLFAEVYIVVTQLQ